jgi:4'-phosphopantetheinyl transferase
MTETLANKSLPGLKPIPAGPDQRVWLLDLDKPTPPRDFSICSDEEHEQSRRMRVLGQSARYLKSHHGLRCLLADATGLDPDKLQFQRNAFDKPALRGSIGVHFNLSHSQRWALIGLRSAGPIGVDIESVTTEGIDQSLAERHLSKNEMAAWRGLPESQQRLAFLRAWTRKEACVKALGTGLSLAPSCIDTGCTAEVRRVAVVLRARPCVLEVRSVCAGIDVLAAVASCDDADAAWAQSHAMG